MWFFCSENPCESAQKIWRSLMRKRVRTCCVLHKCTDGLNHRWLQTDPGLRQYRVETTTFPKHESNPVKTGAFGPRDDAIFESMFLDCDQTFDDEFFESIFLE